MQKRVAVFLVLMAGLVSSMVADANEYQPLEGNFMIGGATLIDPPPEEPKNTHYYLHLTGQSAQALYQMLAGPAKYDECLDDGSLSKQQGAIQCTVSQDKRTYACYFAIDVDQQTLATGAGC